MNPRAPAQADRLARLDDWSALARDAVAHAADPALDPTGTFGQRAEASAVWAWPRAGLMRCKALSQLARLYAQTGPEERAVLAGPMERLAEAVREAPDEVRVEASDAPLLARLPYVED